MNKFLYITITLIVGIVGYGVWKGYQAPPQPQAAGKYDEFAQCLTEKGAVMYGADWCPHCQNQKKLFGASFQYVTYVECPDEPKRCVDAGITGYPSWIFADGAKLEGEQSLLTLSDRSGCQLSQVVRDLEGFSDSERGGESE